MQTCILALGILVAGQIGGARYSDAPADTAPFYGAAETTPSQNLNPLRAENQPPVSNVAPAASAPAGLTKVMKPAVFLENLSKPMGSEKLAGVPLSLAEAVQSARSRDEQTRRVRLYWELSQAAIDFQLASREELEIQSLQNGLGQTTQPWAVALQAATARKHLAHSAVQVAQLCLQKELQRRGESNLPLPSDLPHCGAYETKYEQVFRARTSPEAEQLGKLLPLLHKELGQRSADSSAALKWLNLVRGQMSPQSDSTQLLKAYEQMALQRQTFVATAYRYNTNIARYTQLAVPQEIGTVRLVTMLIQTDTDSMAQWRQGSIRRAAAEEAVPQNNTGRSTPHTYAEPGRSETRRVQPRVDNEDEHSILVSPLHSGQ